MSAVNNIPSINGTSGINPNFNDIRFWAYFQAINDIEVAGNDVLDVNLLECQNLQAVNLDISGNIDLSGTLDVSGNTTIGGTLTVSGFTNIKSGLDVSGNIEGFGDLDISGNITCLSLNVSGNTILNTATINEIDSLDISANNLRVYTNSTLNDLSANTIRNFGSYLGNGNVQAGSISTMYLQDLSANQGDIWYANSDGKFIQLPIGTTGQFLQAVGGYPAWGGVPVATLSQVLTAGNDAGNLNIINLNSLSSSTINNSGNITSSALIGTTRLESNLIENYSGTTLTIDSPIVNFTTSTSLNITVNSTPTLSCLNDRINTAINQFYFTSGSLGTASNFYTGGSYFLYQSSLYPGNPSPIQMYFDPTNHNSQLSTPSVRITNMNASVTDSGTSTVAGWYVIAGGYGFSRNWMVIPVADSTGAQIARMRIALDKAYFATQQHPVRVPSSYTENYYGLLLSSKSQYINQPTKTEAHIYASICEKEKDKNIYGVYTPYDFVLNSMDNSGIEEQTYSLFIPQITPKTKIGYSASGGEGQVWVCDIGGNIEAGDYLTSSKICGVAMKQSDSVFHNYTIFKSAFDCDFTPHLSEYPAYVVDASGERQWVNPDKHEEGFVYEMKTYLNPVYELEVHYDYYEIKGVLKYPFDFKTKQPLLVGKKFKAMLIGGIYQN